MGTYIGADVTLNTIFWIPYWNVNCDTALLKCSRTRRSLSIFIFLNDRYRDLVAFLSVYRYLNIVYEINNILPVSGCNLCKALILSVFPACRHFNLNYSGCSGVNSVIVHLYDLIALLAVSCLCSSFHQLDRTLFWNDSSQFEECRLKHRIDTSSESDFFTNLDTVDGVELNVVLCDISLHLSWQMIL